MSNVQTHINNIRLNKIRRYTANNTYLQAYVINPSNKHIMSILPCCSKLAKLAIEIKSNAHVNQQRAQCVYSLRVARCQQRHLETFECFRKPYHNNSSLAYDGRWAICLSASLPPVYGVLGAFVCNHSLALAAENGE